MYFLGYTTPDTRQWLITIIYVVGVESVMVGLVRFLGFLYIGLENN